MTTTVSSMAAAPTSLRGVGMSGMRDQPAGDGLGAEVAALDSAAVVADVAVVGRTALADGVVGDVEVVHAERIAIPIAIAITVVVCIAQVVTDL
jgi:hypothetical protein